MSVGRYTYGTTGIHFINYGNENVSYTIGSFTSIGAYVKFYLSNGIGHDISFISTYPFGNINQETFPNVNNQSKNTSGDIVIGNDVWIGENVTIMSGITIGNGVVIAANSTVVKNIPDYALVGGNPATIIRYRFSSEQIEKLLKISWWDWEVERINKNIHLICSNNIEEFISSVEL